MIGNQVSPSSINNRLWTLAGMWRQAAYASNDFALAVAALGSGGLTGLLPAGFSSGDATLVLAQAVSLGNLSAAYYGTRHHHPGGQLRRRVPAAARHRLTR